MRFGLLADVQYADKDTRGARRYRDSLGLLEECVDEWSRGELDFCVQLGDVIDGRGSDAASAEDLRSVLAVLGRLDVPVVHVIGNHCLELPRVQLMETLGLERAYSSFRRDGWRFVVLDSLDLSVCGWPEGSGPYRFGSAWLAAHPRTEYPHAFEWNGGFRRGQLDWLTDELADAERAGENVVVFAHNPVVAEAASEPYLAWNHGELRAILDDAPAVVAYVAGHAHSGGYAFVGGVHHVTLQGMVEAPEGSNAFAVVEVFRDRVEVHGFGEVPSRTLGVHSADAPGTGSTVRG